MDVSPLSDYVGLFGNFAYGNVTTYLNVLGTELYMDYGRNGRAREWKNLKCQMVAITRGRSPIMSSLKKKPCFSR